MAKSLQMSCRMSGKMMVRMAEALLLVVACSIIANHQTKLRRMSDIRRHYEILYHTNMRFASTLAVLLNLTVEGW